MWGWETFRERRGKQNSKSVKMKNNISNLSSTHVDPWLFAMNSIRYKRVPNNNPPSPGPYRPLFHIYSFIFRHSTEQQKRSNSISRRRRAISVRYLFQILLGLILIALHIIIIIILLLRRPTIHGRFISSAKLEHYKTQTTVKYDNSLRKNSTFFLC